MSERIITPWWGQFTIPEGESARWRIGPLELWAENAGREWLVGHRRGTAIYDNTQELTIPGGEVPDDTEMARVFVSRPQTQIYVAPRLADRPVVSKPQATLYLPPGEQVQLFLSSPLWFAIETDTPRKQLLEVPVVRPSDTWFGPTTRSGGLSYAAVSLALTSLQDYPFSPFRAVTPVLVRNRASSVLAIERINLPVLYLSLYEAEDGTLWTQPVTLEREEGADETAELQMQKKPPREAGKARLLTGPRRSSERNLVVHAFNALFG